MRENGLRMHQGRFQLDIRKKNCLRRSGEALKQAARGGSEATAPGYVQEKGG